MKALRLVPWAAACACLLWPLAAAAAVDCAGIEGRLAEMVRIDQEVRVEAGRQDHNPDTSQSDRDDLRRRWAAVDAENLRGLKEIVGACGWPAGERASHDAWLLAQHADPDPVFQRQALTLLEAAVKRGTAAARDLAYLSDRIARAEGRPQEYGTQFTMPDRCTLVMSPVDSIEQVNRRRLAVGLQSIEDYEAEGRRRLIPADCHSTSTSSGTTR